MTPRINSDEQEERTSRRRRRKDQDTDDENEALDSQNEAENDPTEALRYKNELFVERFHVLQYQISVKTCNVKTNLKMMKSLKYK